MYGEMGKKTYCAHIYNNERTHTYIEKTFFLDFPYIPTFWRLSKWVLASCGMYGRKIAPYMNVRTIYFPCRGIEIKGKFCIFAVENK